MPPSLQPSSPHLRISVSLRRKTGTRSELSWRALRHLHDGLVGRLVKTTFEIQGCVSENEARKPLYNYEIATEGVTL
jgi:hypothetical protein